MSDTKSGKNSDQVEMGATDTHSQQVKEQEQVSLTLSVSEKTGGKETYRALEDISFEIGTDSSKFCKSSKQVSLDRNMGILGLGLEIV